LLIHPAGLVRRAPVCSLVISAWRHCRSGCSTRRDAA